MKTKIKLEKLLDRASKKSDEKSGDENQPKIPIVTENQVKSEKVDPESDNCDLIIQQLENVVAAQPKKDSVRV
mgnify:CR=1 FL=1